MVIQNIKTYKNATIIYFLDDFFVVVAPLKNL